MVGMCYFWKLLVACFFLMAPLRERAEAQVDPSINWNILRAPHFDVIYPATHEGLAREYAFQAEQAHKTLVPLFGEAPDKTLLIIDDSTDLANGLATGVPQDTIVVNPSLPFAGEPLAHYGNWAEGLVLHEYTHILNIHPTRGFMTPLRWIFGTIVRPNALLPRWYLEGLAVEVESRYTSFGRLRSTYFEGLVRALSLSGDWGQEDIAQINETRTPEIPLGSRPYFFGAWIWNYLYSHQGQEIVRQFNEDFAGRIPFFLNEPAEERVRKPWSGILKSMYADVGARALSQIDILNSVGTSKKEAPPPRFLLKDVESRDPLSEEAPAMSPDGLSLLYVESSRDDDTRIVLVKRNTRHEPWNEDSRDVLVTKRGIRRATWSASGSEVAFEALDIHKRFSLLYDLYSVKLSNKQVLRWTRGARCFEPTFGRTESEMLAICNRRTHHQLVRVTRPASAQDEAQIEVLYTAPLQHRLTTPLFYKDVVWFTERNLEGKEILSKWSPQGQVQRVQTSQTLARAVAVSDRSLTLISESNGVSNVWSLDLNTQVARPMTNTQTHIADGIADGDRWIISELTSRGYRLTSLVATEQKQIPIVPPLTQTSYAKIDTAGSPSPQGTNSSITRSEFPKEEYSALGFLTPKYWIPFFSFIPEGYFVQGTVRGEDPLKKHTYGLDLGFDNLTRRVSSSLVYTNQTTSIPITLLASDIATYLYANGETVRNSQLGIISSFFLPFLSNNWQGTLGWNYIYTQNPLITSGGLRQGPSIGFSYTNLLMRGQQITPENQGQVRLIHTQFLPDIGQVAFAQTNLDATFYWAPQIWKHHTLMIRSNSSWSPSNRSLLLGTVAAGGEFSASLIQTRYITRGYPPGEFLGWSLATANIEYAIPLNRVFEGSDVKPLFTRFWSAALVFDALTLDGGYFDRNTRRLQRTLLGGFFYGAGAELRVDTTIFYHLPATFRLGLYNGFNADAYGGLYPFFGMNIAGL